MKCNRCGGTNFYLYLSAPAIKMTGGIIRLSVIWCLNPHGVSETIALPEEIETIFYREMYLEQYKRCLISGADLKKRTLQCVEEDPLNIKVFKSPIFSFLHTNNQEGPEA